MALGNKIWINISKYEHFTRKIDEILCPLNFLAFSTVLSLLFHYCYSCQKTKLFISSFDMETS